MRVFKLFLSKFTLLHFFIGINKKIKKIYIKFRKKSVKSVISPFLPVKR